MTDDELRRVLADLESGTVERTSAVRDVDKLGEAICAFANDLPNHRKPGVVLIGVRDDGSCANLEISDQLLQNFGAIRSDGNLLPQPSMTVERRQIADARLP